MAHSEPVLVIIEVNANVSKFKAASLWSPSTIVHFADNEICIGSTQWDCCCILNSSPFSQRLCLATQACTRITKPSTFLLCVFCVWKTLPWYSKFSTLLDSPEIQWLSLLYTEVTKQSLPRLRFAHPGKVTPILALPRSSGHLLTGLQHLCSWLESSWASHESTALSSLVTSLSLYLSILSCFLCKGSFPLGTLLSRRNCCGEMGRGRLTTNSLPHSALYPGAYVSAFQDGVIEAWFI